MEMRCFMNFIPACVYEQLRRIYLYVFFTRNCIFQIGYLTLVFGFHAVIICDGLKISTMAEPERDHLRWVFIIAFSNVFVFMFCCNYKPGVLSTEGQGAMLLKQALAAYPYDGVLYQPQILCSTCSLVKPARSKHCRVVNRCIFKFDHYCVWIGNCIGGLNHRFFILLLVSLTIMCVHGVWATFKVFHCVLLIHPAFEAYSQGLPEVSHVGEYLQLVKLMFRYYPRLVFAVMGLSVLSVVVVWFAYYHLALAMNNQTTNEQYKYARLSKDAATGNGSETNLVNIYDRGVIQNLYENFFPLRHLELSPQKKND